MKNEQNSPEKFFPVTPVTPVCKKGEGYVDTVVSVLCAMMVIVLALNTFKFLAIKQDLDYFTKEVISQATLEGKTKSTTIDKRIAELKAKTGLTPIITISANQYYNASLFEVQLGEPISVRLEFHTAFKGFGMFNIPITLITTHSGLSNQYWK